MKLGNLKPANGFAVCFLILGFLGSGQFAQAQFSSLYPASTFDVLTYETPNNSSGAFNGAPLGVVDGTWDQSGGDSAQEANTVVVSSASDETIGGGGPGNVTYSFSVNPTLLNNAWTAATNSSSNYSRETASAGQTYGTINNESLDITESAVGNYVVDFTSTITFNQNNITFSAPAGSTFLVNIAGDVTMSGGSAGDGFLTVGGITANDVVYNLLGSGTALSTSGMQTIDGTVLAVDGMVMVQATPVVINGELITYMMHTSSDASVTYDPVPVPEPTTLALAGLGGLSLLFLRRRK